MLWLWLLFAFACVLLYILIARPILKRQPILSPAFKAEASLRARSATMWPNVDATL
jgi:hypothetical protein